MRGIFWVPIKAVNLIKLVLHLDKRPLIAGIGGPLDEHALADQSRYLADWFRDDAIKPFKQDYRPWFMRTKIVKGGADTGNEVIQPLDRRSIFFFLGGWERSSDTPIIFSGDSDNAVIAGKLAAYYGGDVPSTLNVLQFMPTYYPESLIADLAGSSRYVIFTEALADVSAGVVIVSKDDALLQEIFSYLESLGELGFVYDGSPESEKRLTQMSSREPGGMYLDDIPAGFTRLT